jgi:transposase-like protein
LVVISKQNDTSEQEIARLRKELARAKLERDSLKKVTAYFSSQQM